MQKLTYIITAFLISVATLAPEGMVLCKKNGKVSIELEQGESCSCQSLISDLIEQFCCDEIECHEEEILADTCHEENQINDGNCQDTKLDLPKFIKAQDFHNKIPTKVFLSSHFFYTLENIHSLTKEISEPRGLAPPLKTPIDLTNSPLCLNKSTFLII